MKKITILALHLGTGGIENSISNLSNMLSEKYEVNIISTYKLDEPSFKISDKVKISYLLEDLKPNKKELREAIKSKNILKIIKELMYSLKVLKLRKSKLIEAVKKLDSDIIISTRDFYNEILGKYAKKGVIKIAQEHNHHNFDEKYINKIVKSLKNIDYFMPVSQELTDFYEERLKKSGNNKIKCVYIKHTVDKKSDQVSKLNGNTLISVGRLSKEKGFLDLIDVFKKIADLNDNVILKIAGDGDQREAIEEKIKLENLENRVKLFGILTRDELEKEYASSDIYVMTSFTESFGLVLVEAESFGLPCVVMDSARGALEIIEQNKNGIIIENRDKDKMADEILKLLKYRERMISMGKEGIEKSKEYTNEKISKKWFEFIENLEK